jgi:hypothetical protein
MLGKSPKVPFEDTPHFAQSMPTKSHLVMLLSPVQNRRAEYMIRTFILPSWVLPLLEIPQQWRWFKL